MENTLIITSPLPMSEPTQILPIKKRQPSTEQIYKSLVTYPISKEVVRYTKITEKTIQPAFHDLLQTNLNLLVPNIDIGYQMDMNHNQMFDWLLTAKEYVSKLNEDFQQRCDRKTQKIIEIEQHKERAKKFNMEAMDKLPEDIIRYIYDYLMPETRIALLRARYPNLDANVKKLKVPILKCLLKNINNKYYTPMMNSLYKTNRNNCLPVGFYLSFSYFHKENCVNKINKFIGTCETAVAHSQSDYRYFQRKALRILRSLVYVAKYKKVLDKPYAPELEPPKPVKKPRKPRTKK
jgi:hypothetical protein